MAPCPQFNRFAGLAIFAYGEASLDPAAGAIVKALELKQYPTLSVLDPNPDRIVERFRAEAIFPATEYEEMLLKVLTVPWRRVPPAAQTCPWMSRWCTGAEILLAKPAAAPAQEPDDT